MKPNKSKGNFSLLDSTVPLTVYKKIYLLASIALLRSSAAASLASRCSAFLALSSASSANLSPAFSSAVWLWVNKSILAFCSLSSLINAISLSFASSSRAFFEKKRLTYLSDFFIVIHMFVQGVSCRFDRL